jgi:hypothetical protein
MRTAWMLRKELTAARGTVDDESDASELPAMPGL